MPRKRRSLAAILALCFAISIFASLLAASGWLDVLELKTVDSRFQLRYWLNEKWKRIGVTDQAVLVGIDQSAVDPTFSEFSDRWGMGGWLTRDTWVKGVEALSRGAKPRVVSYDILFTPHRTGSARKATPGQESVAAIESEIRQKRASLSQLAESENFPRLEILEILDESGNGTFASRFHDVDDARAQGAKMPEFVMSYYFAPAAVQRTDAARLGRLKAEALPPGSVVDVPADYAYAENAVLPFDLLLEAPIHLGFIDVPRDQDGNIRRIPLVHGFRDPAGGAPIFVPSLALQSCLSYLGIAPAGGEDTGIRVRFGHEIELWSKQRRLRIPIDRQGNLFLNFEGKIADYPQISYIDVLRGASSKRVKELLEDKIAFVGVTFTGASDVGPCAIDSNVPFTFIHLVAVDNILRQDFLRPIGRVGSVAVLWALIFGVGLLNFASAARANALGTAGLLIAYLTAALMLFYLNAACIPVVMPVLFIIATLGAISLYRYQVEQKARLEIRRKFAAMVSKDLLEYMEEHPDTFALGGERRETTIFFSDVAGFTRVSETLSPSELVQVINEYLTPMSEIILKNKGYLNKYLGDGIMAVWGAPVWTQDHAERACLAALEQQRKIEELRPRFQREHGIDLSVRMGINSGPVDAGNMGSLDRLEYTVMGDAVNLAARLEPANKDYGTRIIIARGTEQLIPKGRFATRLLDRIVVQGKTERVEIFELLGTRDQLSEGKTQAAEYYERGLKLHWERKWAEALEALAEALKAAPGDTATAELIERIKAYQAEPPREGWQGEHLRESKS